MGDTARDSLLPSAVGRRTAIGRALECLQIMLHTDELPAGGADDLRMAATFLRPTGTDFEDRTALVLAASSSFESSRLHDVYSGLEKVASQLEEIAAGDLKDRHAVESVIERLHQIRRDTVASQTEPPDIAHLG